MPESIIHTEHLSRFFGTIKAVDDLSLEVPAGIVFGFLGLNRAGKTTTIHLLLGLVEPTAGQASVLGFDIRTQADAIRARSGALLEFAGLYERMSAQDNLDLYGRINRMPAPARQARIKELLTHLDLWDRRRDAEFPPFALDVELKGEKHDDSQIFRPENVDRSLVPQPAGCRDVDRTPPCAVHDCRSGRGVRHLQRTAPVTTAPVARGPELRLAVHGQRAVSQLRHP